MTKEKKEDYLHSKKFHHFLHDEEQRLKSSVIKLFAVFFLILIALNSYQIFKLTHAFGSVEKYNQGVVKEVGQMKEGVVDFANDLNEIRNYLYLPTREYFAEKEGEETVDEEAQESSAASQALYKLLSSTADEKKKQETFAKHCRFIRSLHENQNWSEQLVGQELKMEELTENESSCSFKISKNQVALYNLTAHLENKENVLVQSALGEEKIQVTEGSEQNVMDYIQQNTKSLVNLKERLENQKLGLKQLFEKEEIKKIMDQEQWTLAPEGQEEANAFVYKLSNKAGENVDTIKIERKTGDFLMGGEVYKDAALFQGDLIRHLKHLAETLSQPNEMEKKRNELEAVFRERAFEELLKQSELQISHSPRQEGSRLIYELKNKNDQVVMSIVLDVGSGKYSLIQNGQESDLLSILQPTGEEKKNLELPSVLPEFGDSPKSGEGLTLLVAGKHGSLVDTMMVVRLAEGKISIVSVPRDLYWNGRKINSVYAFYGMDELLRVLSQISGYQIDHYVLIDMYAFIEVVDLIGCIDVTLEQTLIDPTYKTLDNGVWGTLYYPAGTHHLCGKQALRIARSRHTSSDFSRAQRQHLILEALKNKAQEIGLKDAGTLKDLAQTSLKYVETDLNAAQMMAYYFRFKDFKMNGGYVMTSGNVLESTFTGDLNGGASPSCTTNEAGEQVCSPANKGAYILLPRGGNWNNIKWFFHQAFEEGGEKLN